MHAPFPQAMNGRERLPAGGVFGAKMVWPGSVASVNICAGYGPDPDVLWPAPRGVSGPVSEPPEVYLGRSERETLKMPPAKSPSPFAGKFPGEGVKAWGRARRRDGKSGRVRRRGCMVDGRGSIWRITVWRRTEGVEEEGRGLS